MQILIKWTALFNQLNKKMKNIYLLSMLIVSISAFCQQSIPLKFGIELDGKLKKIDPNTQFDSPTGAAYIGMFAELHVSNHFSGKVRVGLNNTYYHNKYVLILDSEYEYECGYGYGEGYGCYYGGPFTSKTWIKPTLQIGFEPRLYFFSTERLRKTNFFAAIPVMFDFAPSWTVDFAYVRSELIILPSLGCRYDFTKHWGIEASGGLGWGRYYGKFNNNPIKKQEMEYGLSVGMRYTF